MCAQHADGVTALPGLGLRRLRPTSGDEVAGSVTHEKGAGVATGDDSGALRPSAPVAPRSRARRRRAPVPLPPGPFPAASQERHPWHEADEPPPTRDGHPGAHRLGDPRRRRRDPARRRDGDRLDHLLVGRQPVGAGPPGQPARVPDRALRRRGAPPPRRPGAAPARAGTTTTGSARCRPASTRRGPSTSAGRCRPSPTRGAATTPGPSTSRQPLRDALRASGRRDGGDLADRALPRRRLPRRRCCTAVRHRDEIEAVLARLPHQEGRARRPSPSRRPPRSPTPSPTDDDGPTRQPATWPGSRSSPTAATAAATPPRSRRTTTRRPTSPTPARSAATPAPPTWPRRTRASWSGRSTGRCAGPSSTSTSSRPAWTTRRPARRSPSGTSWSRTSSGCPRAGVVRLRLRRLRRACRRCRRRAGGAPDRGGRAAGARGADPALALRAPPAQAGLQHRLRPRGGAALRRVGRAGPQGRRPRQARRAGARLRARLGDRGRRAAADARRSSCRSGCCRRSPT